MPPSSDDAAKAKSKGNEYFKTGQYVKALKYYRQATQLAGSDDPNAAVYWSNLAATYDKLGNEVDAEHAARECVRADPSFVKGYFRLAQAQWKLGELDECHRTCSRGLDVEPGHPDLLQMQRQVEAKQRNKNERSANAQAESIKAQGNDFFGKGKYKQALERYRTATELDDSVPVYWSNLAACHEKLSQSNDGHAEDHLEDMEHAARQCIKADSTFVKGYFRLATAQKRLHDLEGCLETCNDGLKVEPHHPDLLVIKKDVEAELRQLGNKYNDDEDDSDDSDIDKTDEILENKRDLFAKSWALKKKVALEWESVYERALEGEMEAQYDIGYHYQHGYYHIMHASKPKNQTSADKNKNDKPRARDSKEQAFKWMEKAANNGHPGALYWMGEYYHKKSQQGEEDPDVYFEYFKKAYTTAKQLSKQKKKINLTLGLYWLSICHRDGKCHDLIERENDNLGAHTGIDKRSIKQQKKKHYTLALEYMEKAAQESYPPAQYALGVGNLYAAQGKGPFGSAIRRVDRKSGLDWLETSCFWFGQLDASSRTVNGQYELGKWHARGKGLLGKEADPYYAVVWLSRAAVRGHARARAELKVMIQKLSSDSTAEAPKKNLLARFSQRDTKEDMVERHDKALLYCHKHYLVSNKVLDKHEEKLLQRDKKILRQERRREEKEERQRMKQANGGRRASWFGGSSRSIKPSQDREYYSDEESYYSGSYSGSGGSYTRSRGSYSGSYSGSSYSSRSGSYSGEEDYDDYDSKAPPSTWRRSSPGGVRNSWQSNSGRSSGRRRSDGPPSEYSRRSDGPPSEYSRRSDGPPSEYTPTRGRAKQVFPDDMSEISSSNRDFDDDTYYSRTSSRRGKYYD